MKTLKPTPSFLVLLFLIAAIYPGEAVACTCYPPRPVNERLENSRVVVVARLTEIVGEFNLSNEPYFSRWKVEKVYKGDLRTEDTIELWQGGVGSCIRHFRKEQVNSRLLLFMHDPTTEFPSWTSGEKLQSSRPRYNASYCSGSTELEHAGRDIKYLDKLDELRDKTRLSGTLHAGNHAGFSLADVKIKVIGEKKTLDLKSDRTGYFESYDLPPGEYRLDIPVQPGWKLNDPRAEYPTGLQTDIGKPYVHDGTIRIPISLGERRHIALDLFFEPAGGVRGRVVGPAGEPIYQAPMRLSKNIDFSDHGNRPTTDGSGEFEFRAIKPGKYYLGIFSDGLVSPDVPFATVYYPGTFDKSEARMVEIGVDVPESLLIQVPELMPVVELKGRLFYSDGKPAKGSVRFESAGAPFRSETVGSDEEGNFSLKILAAAKGKVVGHTSIDHRRSGCSEWMQLLGAAKKDYIQVSTNEINYSGEPLSKPIDLTLPIRSCDKPV